MHLNIHQITYRYGSHCIDDNTDQKFWRSLVRSPARPIFFPRIDDNHCDRIHSSLTAVRCFDNGYVEKQPVAWKEYCVEHWLKELQGSMDRCTNRRVISKIPLKTALDTIQSINKSIICFFSHFYLAFE